MRKFTDRINKITEKLGIVFLFIMLLIVSMQVITRLTIKTTPRWAEEVSLILMVWFSFIGIAIGVKEKSHIAITFLTDILPKKIRKIILSIDELLILFYGGAVFWYGARLVYATRTSTLPATQWPSYVPYLILPFVGLAIVLYCLVNTADIIKGKDHERLGD